MLQNYDELKFIQILNYVTEIKYIQVHNIYVYIYMPIICVIPYIAF